MRGVVGELDPAPIAGARGQVGVGVVGGAAAGSGRRELGTEPAAKVVGGEGAQETDIDELALAGAASDDQGSQNAVDGRLRGAETGDWDGAVRRRRSVVLSGEAAITAGAGADQ